jgi:hypothetical protein
MITSALAVAAHADRRTVRILLERFIEIMLPTCCKFIASARIAALRSPLKHTRDAVCYILLNRTNAEHALFRLVFSEL